MISLTRACVAAVLVAPAIGALGAQQVPRDAPPPSLTGSAVISGVVIAEAPPHQPLRLARVILTGGGTTRGATTDAGGRFAFRDLPAATYTIHGMKEPWVMTEYGATRAGRSGTPVALAAGQRLEGITLKLARGAVVTGTVRDEAGQPQSDVAISIVPVVSRNGERFLTGLAVLSSHVRTDDLGVYRAYGLPPGEFVVRAAAVSPVPALTDDYRPLTTADVTRALQLAALPAGVPVAPVRDQATGASRPPTATMAIVYYPGTHDPRRAQVLTLTAGEERGGIDFPLVVVPTAHVTGTVTGPDGLPRANVGVVLVAGAHGAAGASGGRGAPQAVTDRDGRFRLTSIVPGDYSLVAATTTGPLHWAQAEVTVSGADVETSLGLQPGMTVSGRVVFDGAPAPPDRRAFLIRLQPAGGGFSMTGAQEEELTDEGAFTFPAVAPGRYRLTLSPASAGPWIGRASIARGQDTLDVPLDIRAGEHIADWTLTVTNRPSELTGRLVDALGRPAPQFVVLAFCTDRTFWTPFGRRIAEMRPGADGTFSVKGLPPGEYFLAALTDVEPDEWLIPGFLDGLISAAIRVRIVEGQKTVQGLQISGGHLP